MRAPGWKRTLAALLFLFLFVSSMAFGVLLFTRTFEVVSFDGRTALTGRVVDTEGDPIEEVMVTCRSSFDLTDRSGTFLLGDVPEGRTELSFYKPGFVVLELIWVAYPLKEIEGDLQGSVNNISRDLDIVLYREARTMRPLGPYENGTLRFVTEWGGTDLAVPTALEVSNGTGYRLVELLPGQNVLGLQGNGTFFVRTGPAGPEWRSFHPVGSTIDITGAVKDLVDGRVPERLDPGILRLNITSGAPSMSASLEVLDLDGRVVTTESLPTLESAASYLMEVKLPPGIYDVRVSGELIMDTMYGDLPLSSGDPTLVNISLERAGRDRLYEGLEVDDNYYLAALNIVLGGLFLLGATVSLKGGSWFIMVPLAFLGFISNGAFELAMDPNHIASFLLVLVLVSLFREERTRRIRART